MIRQEGNQHIIETIDWTCGSVCVIIHWVGRGISFVFNSQEYDDHPLPALGIIQEFVCYVNIDNRLRLWYTPEGGYGGCPLFLYKESA